MNMSDLKDLELKKDVAELFEQIQDKLEVVDEIFRHKHLKLKSPNNAFSVGTNELYQQLYSKKRELQHLLNLFNNYDIYAGSELNMQTNNHKSVNESVLKDELIEGLYEYVLFYLIIKREESRQYLQPAIENLQGKSLKCNMCDYPIDVNNVECEVCNEPIKAMIKTLKYQSTVLPDNDSTYPILVWKCNKCNKDNVEQCLKCETCSELRPDAWSCMKCGVLNPGSAIKCGICDQDISVEKDEFNENKQMDDYEIIQRMEIDRPNHKEVDDAHLTWNCIKCRQKNDDQCYKCSTCQEPRSNVWSCIKCTVLNNESAINCRVCGFDADKVARETNPQLNENHLHHINDKNVLEKITVIDETKLSTKWKCEICSVFNRDNPNQCDFCATARWWICKECGIENKLSNNSCVGCNYKKELCELNRKATIQSDGLCGRYETNMANWECWYRLCKRTNDINDDFCKFCGLERFSNRTPGALVRQKCYNKIYGVWICSKCEKLNSVHYNFCCFKRRNIH